MCTGISAAEELPFQKASAAAAGKKLAAAPSSDSDSAGFSNQEDQHSDSDDDDDDDGADLLMEDSDRASEQDSELSREALEDRQAGVPAESSDRATVTPGKHTARV